MTKRKINNKPKYNVNDVVYAIAFMNDSDTDYGKTKEKDEQDFIRIFKVVVESIWINSEGTQYMLKDYRSDNEWQVEVPEEHISFKINELYKYLNKRWKI